MSWPYSFNKAIGNTWYTMKRRNVWQAQNGRNVTVGKIKWLFFFWRLQHTLLWLNTKEEGLSEQSYRLFCNLHVAELSDWRMRHTVQDTFNVPSQTPTGYFSVITAVNKRLCMSEMIQTKKKEQLSAARQRSLSMMKLLFGKKRCYEYKKQTTLFIHQQSYKHFCAENIKLGGQRCRVWMEMRSSANLFWDCFLDAARLQQQNSDTEPTSGRGW